MTNLTPERLDEIERADEIDAQHGDGIAHETRALAMKLKSEMAKETQ